MKIVRLSIKNFLGIKEALIEPGKINILSGKNGQGKSSILKAIEAVFKGAPFSVIHKGTERAELIAELEDIRVTRVITHKAMSVTVKTKEGFTRPAPQTYLDGLFGSFAFNPLAFLMADAKERRNYLLRAMAVTVTRQQIVDAAGGIEVPVPNEGPALDQYADACRMFYQNRTEVNRRLKQKQGAAEEVAKKLPEGFKPDEKTEERKKAVTGNLDALGRRISALEAKRDAAAKADKTRTRIKEEQDRLQKVHRDAADAAKAITCTATDLGEVDNLIVRLEEQITTARKNRAHIVAQLHKQNALWEEGTTADARIRANIETLKELPPPFDAAEIEVELDKADGLKAEQNALVAQMVHEHTFSVLAALKEEVQTLEDEAGGLSYLVEKFGKELPAKALAEAKLPIEDLAVDGTSVTVKGIPIEDLATSEQIGVTLSIARAMAKEIPLVCIDGVERLDDEMFAEFVRQAGNDGFQYFVTRVGKPRKGELAVRDGKVGG